MLHFKVGHAPLHHAIIGVIRSFGRAGVPVTTTTEDRFTPAALSRYLSKRIEWTPDAFTDPDEVLERLVGIGREMGGKPIIVCTDDEAAIIVAEGADTLRQQFTLPLVSPGLPRRLAGKQSLAELCQRYGVPTPPSACASSCAELEKLIAEFQLPVVAKNVDPWQRRTQPTVMTSTIVHSPEQLLRKAATWREPFRCLLQEYLPEESSEDWVVQGYCGEHAQVVFTARKLRAWPPFTGQMAYGRLQHNPELVARTLELCEQVGYRGIFDIDFRLDRRSGTFYLLDFNPRVGAPFCLFESEVAVDVVRAMHLDLSGRPIPLGAQRDGLRLVVEPLALAAGPAYRGHREPQDQVPAAKGPLRFAWFAWDDPLPFVAMGLRQLWSSLRARLRWRGPPKL